MKKKVIAVIAAAVLLAAALSGCFSRMKDPGVEEAPDSKENSLVIKASNVDNSLNNQMANTNDFVTQIGDRIYTVSIGFEHDRLCEISSGTTKAVYAQDNENYNSVYGDISNFAFVYDGKICMPETSFIHTKLSDAHIDVETGEITKPETVYYEGSGLDYSIVSGGKLYYCDYSRLGCYDNGENKLIATADDMQVDSIQENAYIAAPYIYYSQQSGQGLYLCRYDFEKKELTDRVKVTDTAEEYDLLGNIIADGDDVYCIYGSKLYHVNLSGRLSEEIFSCDYEYGMMFNYCDKKLYIGVNWINDDTQPGLYVLDTEKPQEEAAVLVKDEGVDGVYIFDDEYVYYVCSYDKLSRVRLSDNSVELVFDYHDFTDTANMEEGMMIE